jgi:hypothetical protein
MVREMDGRAGKKSKAKPSKAKQSNAKRGVGLQNGILLTWYMSI